jgi:hypothetical protein
MAKMQGDRSTAAQSPGGERLYETRHMYDLEITVNWHLQSLLPLRMIPFGWNSTLFFVR